MEQLQKALEIQKDINFANEILCELIQIGENMLENNTELFQYEREEIQRINSLFKSQLEQLKEKAINELKKIRDE